MSQQFYYTLTYVVLIVAAIVGMALKVLPTDIGSALIAFVVGHGAGLITPTPPAPPTKGNSSVS